MECDVLVVGSGTGALCGALIAATSGLETTVIEKTEYFGGTTAYSGGAMWMPLSEPTKRAGIEDSPERVHAYLDAIVGPERRSLREAYLQSGPGIIAELETNAWLDFEWRPFPDYFGEAPGAHPAGRSIYAVDFDVSGHETALEQLRPPLPPRKGARKDPLPTILGGRAFLARLLVALSEAGAVLLCNTALEGLVSDGGRVTGAHTTSGPIRARRGVLLAAGGFERNPQLRGTYLAPLGSDWTLGAPGNTGRRWRRQWPLAPPPICSKSAGGRQG